ncbi:hypothetical protein EJ110_NYTH34512 [Nymphaea thermarum]|nr:hypothetical protein EJ110_NYTH34512 [Nymphaea thermarum]
MEMGGPEDSANGREALLPSPAPNNGKSWASIVDGGRLQANMDMPPLEKKEMDGKRRLTISQQSYEVLCQPFRFSAIATLTGGAGKGRLYYSFIFASLKTLWPEVADLRFTSVGKDMFLLRTSSEADLHLILSPGRWYVGGKLLIANQWHPGMPMRIESSNRVRIWIRLPDLPVEWWNPRIFTDIADLIGASFVEADDYARHLQRFGFARIKIEIPLGLCPTSEIELEISGGKVFVQSIERRPYNKEKEIPTKQNKFQALVLQDETETNGESPTKQPDERDLGCKEGEVQGSHKSGDENMAEAGVTPVALSTQLGTDVNGLKVFSNSYTTEKAKKRTFKHKEVNGIKKRSNPSKESDSTEKLDGHLQESRNLSMVEVTAAHQEGQTLDEMDVGVVEAKSFSDAMEEENEDDCAEDQMASWEGRGENDELLSPVTDNEFNCAVMDAERDSAPGPDGFGNSFFQSIWSLLMNNVKSSVLPFNLDSHVLTQIEHELGWRQGQLPSKYLGIPLQTTDVTEEQCRDLVLRSSQKLTVWKQKYLSSAGRLSLIKHVLSMLPSYWRLVIKHPATICKQLNKMAADFLWGVMADHKNYHRIKWATLCLPKLEGGVGLRDINETNIANLAFLVYRVSQQSFPWDVLVKGRYCERKGLIDSNMKGKRVSKAWRRIQQAWRAHLNKIWLRSGVLWSDEARYDDRWVEISVASWFKDGRKGVVGLIRDASSRFRFGLACWFENNNAGWREAEVLMECLLHLINIDDNLVCIYILANDGDWKRHLHNSIDCCTDFSYNFSMVNSYLPRLSIARDGLLWKLLTF